MNETEYNAKIDAVAALVVKIGADMQAEIDAIKKQNPSIPQSSVDKLTALATQLQSLDTSILANTPAPPAP